MQVINGQKVFNAVARHLMRQGCKSTANDMCMYRSHDGLKCAVGIFIPDALYTKEMETKGVEDVIDIAAPSMDYLQPYAQLLHDLQCVHDRYEVEDWSSELKVVAEKHGLYYTP